MVNDDQEGMAGAAGDNVSSGVSVSGVGGQELGTEAGVADEGIGGIDDIVEQARRTAWGRNEPAFADDRADDERA
ncbi:MAG TPA: hypothetical protein VF045_11375 [Acidimicrobiales bacterium]